MDKIEKYIEQLKHPNANVRWMAARSLGEIKDPRSIEPLIKALKEGDANVRWNAAWSLGQIKDPIATEPLIEALKDKDTGVRWIATRSLGEIGTPAVVRLIECLQDKNANVGQYAAQALGQIKDPIATEPLIESLKDEDAHVRSNAAESLGEIINAQNSIEKLDEIRRCLSESVKSDSPTYKHTRKLVLNLLIILNARKNQLVSLDIQLDARIKPPKKPEGGTYRMERRLAT